jgi:cell wall-associated NlpC family hydrolase
VHGLSSARHRRASNALSGKLALKVGICLCAGQLIAGPLMASAANAAPVAVEAKAVAPAKVTETVNRSTITKGASVRVTARVINPKTGKVVTSGRVRLQTLRNNHWRSAGLKAVSKGYAVFYTKTGGTYRSVFLGSNGVGGAASNKILVRVGPTGAADLAEATGPSRFDCSGFTMYVYKKAAGKSLPHKANSQQKYGKAISKSKKQVGDLIIFRSGSYGYHAAIYAGGNYMYDSPHTGARVGKHKIFGSNYVVRRLTA